MAEKVRNIFDKRLTLLSFNYLAEKNRRVHLNTLHTYLNKFDDWLFSEVVDAVRGLESNCLAKIEQNETTKITLSGLRVYELLEKIRDELP